MEHTGKTVIIGETIGTVIWTALKSWFIALTVVALGLSVPILLTYDYSAASLVDIFRFFGGTLIIFVLCIGIGFVFSIPLGLLGGFCAYIFAKPIAQNPLRSIAIATAIGVPVTVLYLSATLNRRFGGITETFMMDINAPSTIIYAIAVFSAVSYLCLKLHSRA